MRLENENTANSEFGWMHSVRTDAH